MRLKEFFSEIYWRLVKINDTNQRIALGMGLGVFFGIIPGAGPIISLIFASLIRVNKASALIGCLATNTWISIVTALLAVKLGAFIFKIEWRVLLKDTNNLIQNFNFSDLFNLAVLKTLAPLFFGYLIIALIISLMAYLISLALIKQFRLKNR